MRKRTVLEWIFSKEDGALDVLAFSESLVRKRYEYSRKGYSKITIKPHFNKSHKNEGWVLVLEGIKTDIDHEARRKLELENEQKKQLERESRRQERLNRKLVV
jgi:hypothetical protein